MINNDKQLAQYLETIEDVKLLGIDTEFRRVDSYFPELCLIQIATDEQLECIDVLSIKSLEPLLKNFMITIQSGLFTQRDKTLKLFIIYLREFQKQSLTLKLLQLS